MNIHASVEQVLQSREIIGNTFYDVFFRRHPEVRGYFAGVNLARQGVLLTMAIAVIEQYYKRSYPATERYLHYLGTRHEELGIPASAYPGFRDALLETLAQFHGQDWTAELAAEWQAAIDKTTQTMLESYRKQEIGD